MTEQIIRQLSRELNIQQWQAENTVGLLAEGATIPFIARYRKEQTGSLDDTQLREFGERLAYLENLAKRKEEVISSIEGMGQMTPELLAAIGKAAVLVEVEDLYRPYRPKRRTRASMAKERGLEPLALYLLEQKKDSDPAAEAEKYVDEEKGVPDSEAALAGAMDIIAETVSDDADVRGKLRAYLMRTGRVVTVAAKDEDSVYANYYDFDEAAARIPGYRILAIDRGEREGFLKVSLEADSSQPLDIIYDRLVTGESPAKQYLLDAGADAYSRLVFPSLENEIRGVLTERAADAAIKVFGENLQQLLMQPPVKDRVVLGLDPAYRTGCKIAVVDATGRVLDTVVVYPTPPQKKVEEASRILKALIKKHGVTVISIGNGTASRESESFVAGLIGEIDGRVSYMVVSEAGASVYSASKLAAEEFPEFDVSLRSAVSIARRIQDPLAELVKIDPKAIGVGQYQHDMPKAKLSGALEG
ncbi:MAG: RNA-binding transcriptional accessory protein, partial [Oscillospiraceae bacterium]|nr:RNA-binding transcriptional accessory protein [Oscillospiraceae bacterium]